jgi:hypothetical protein
MRKSDAEGLSFAVPAPFACTILRLLQEGRDPSPPARLVDFAVDADEEQTLLVAHTRLPGNMLDLRTGDRVLAVSGSTRQLQTETDLVDALRGHLDDVSLTVRRGLAVITVNGRWPAAPVVTRREGLWVSGVLFAAADSFTAGLIAGQPAVMVHHVESGSDAEAAGLRTMDLVTAVDGQGIDSLDALEAAARRAQSGGQPLDLMLLRMTDEDQDALFQYQHRFLDVGDLARIGPQARKAQPAAGH